MKNVSQDYIKAVTDYGREWQNTVTITDGVHTETYTSCEINIEEVFSETDSLSMGRSFASKCSLKVYEPQRTVLYQNSTITIVSKLMVNNALVDVSMGTFYPSEVKTENDYETLDIVAYDEMARLDVPYEPTVTLPCKRKDIVNDICTQYGLEKGDGVVKVYDNHQLIDSEHFEAVSGTILDSRYWLSWEEADGKLKLYVLKNRTVSIPTTIPIVSNISLVRGHRYLVLLDDTNGRLTLTLQGDYNTNVTQSQIITNDSYDTLKLVCSILWDDIPTPIYSDTFLCQVIDLTEKIGDEPITVEEYIQNFGSDYEPINGTQAIAFGDEVIDTIYEGTVAETLGYMAGLIGKNAIFNSDNKLVFRWYTADLRYGTRWQDLLNLAWQDLDGTWATEFVDIVNFDRSFQHQDGLSLNEGTFTINSITSGSGDNVYTAGTGKGITFENPYITQELVNNIYANLPQDYKTFYVGEVNTFGMPCAEVGDIVYAQMKDGEKRVIYLSNNTWNLSGGCSCITQSVGVPDAEIEFSTESPTEKKLNKFKTTMQEVKARLSNLINSTVGYYTMTEENGIPTGWTIKDNLEHPQNMVKASLGGIGYSRDGGITYDNAITGEGIIADAITTGSLSADRISGGSINTSNFKSEGTKYFYRSNYSSTDRTRIQSIITHSIVPTDADFDKYDLNADGTISSLDYAICGNMINGDYGTYLAVDYRFEINQGETEISCYTRRYSQNGSYDTGWKQLLSLSAGGIRATEPSTSKSSHIGGNTITTNNLTVYGDGYMTGYLTQGSREELKKNIEPSEEMLEKVLNSDIYSYNYKTEEDDDKKHYGVIIGEDYRCAEEIISKNRDGVDSYSMTSILWKSVQELAAKVEELEKQVGGN